MRTTLDLNNNLIKEAMAATGLKTKKAVIEAGLQSLISHQQIEGFIASFGSIPDFETDTFLVRTWRNQEESVIEPGSVNEPPVS